MIELYNSLEQIVLDSDINDQNFDLSLQVLLVSHQKLKEISTHLLIKNRYYSLAETLIMIKTQNLTTQNFLNLLTKFFNNADFQEGILQAFLLEYHDSKKGAPYNGAYDPVALCLDFIKRTNIDFSEEEFRVFCSSAKVSCEYVKLIIDNGQNINLEQGAKLVVFLVEANMFSKKGELTVSDKKIRHIHKHFGFDTEQSLVRFLELVRTHLVRD